MRFSPQFWKKKSRKSVFGGQVQPVEEVKALNDRIKKVEKKELEQFEKEFEKQAQHLWK
ncbi:hypothetical protein K9L63_03550 [Candidatus Gracilibacteria bacterium]|nr:hypothetical protein [Candidatus Gracilibacteria bacterium]